ncbi:hypothetical protein RO07_25405 [Pandoraea pulmonicola]|uniref:Lipid A biosynthesis lauroyl acyltransferase n=1 Tax=Pandoraea pulmonicola TaxID=93221 RepID=A0AAJ4Z851_PANPU|nr:hypothetical protein RO07_25405 [Pandoraea pulmonicola]SUA88584.1 lipid A biosynthesis lauroyl acyltransferase [Pandoraea pulmonicola]
MSDSHDRGNLLGRLGFVVVVALLRLFAVLPYALVARFGSAIQWYGSAQRIRNLVQIDSRIDLEDKNAPPTIFLGFHFVSI